MGSLQQLWLVKIVILVSKKKLLFRLYDDHLVKKISSVDNEHTTSGYTAAITALGTSLTAAIATKPNSDNYQTSHPSFANFNSSTIGGTNALTG